MTDNTIAIKIRQDLVSASYLKTENENEKNGKPKLRLPFFIPNRRGSNQQIKPAKSQRIFRI
jgi:hypothetical protein